MSLLLENEIAKYLKSIPTLPANISDALNLIKQNNLIDAAKIIDGDPALKAYVLSEASRPVFGLQEQALTASHALSLFGVSASVAMLETFLLRQLTPRRWHIFKITNEKYFQIQAELIASWQKILDKALPSFSTRYVSAASLLASSIPICDAVFASKQTEIAPFLAQGLTYNDVLTRLGGSSLYALAARAGQQLGFDKAAVHATLNAEKPPQTMANKEHLQAIKLLHLLFFYRMSKPDAIEAGLNDFVSCEASAVEDELENFMNITGFDFEN